MLPRDRRRWLTAVLLAGLTAAPAGPAAAQERAVPDGFATVARLIGPAVVNVSARRLIRERFSPDIYRDPQIRQMLSRRLGSRPSRLFRQLSLGSGVIVDPRGYILTNAHLVFLASEISVRTLDGREYPATVAGADPATDLAVLKLQEGRSWPAAMLGDSDQVQAGDWVISAGSPFGLDQSLSVGIVSAKGRLMGREFFIQTDAALNPGSSGGPLVDVRGRVIGITSAILDKSGVVTGVGFAVPSNTARRVLGDILAAGPAPRGRLGAPTPGAGLPQTAAGRQPLPTLLGFQAEALTPEAGGRLATDDLAGVVVTTVEPARIADRAGLEAGDIIRELNHQPVRSLEDYRRILSHSLRPGAELLALIERRGYAIKVVMRVPKLKGSRSAPAGTPAELMRR